MRLLTHFPVDRATGRKEWRYYIRGDASAPLEFVPDSVPLAHLEQIKQILPLLVMLDFDKECVLGRKSSSGTYVVYVKEEK